MFLCGGQYTEKINQTFIEKFSDTDLPHRNAVRKLVSNFPEAGTRRSGRPSILTEEKLLDISDVIAYAQRNQFKDWRNRQGSQRAVQ